MTLFERTKELSKSKGWNLQTTAEKAGLSQNAIYNWKNKEPSKVSLRAVASVLDVSTDYLLGRTDDINSTTDDELTPAQKEVAHFIDPSATQEDIEQIKKLVEIAKLSKRRL